MKLWNHIYSTKATVQGIVIQNECKLITVSLQVLSCKIWPHTAEVDFNFDNILSWINLFYYNVFEN